MKNAIQRLNEVVKKRGPLLAGLDPDFEKILPMYHAMNALEREVSYETEYDSVEEFLCKHYLETLAKTVGAVKINSAFFEKVHMEQVFLDVAYTAKDMGYYVIGDLKRADIGNTSSMYAKAYLCKNSPFDAITINPYFGTDGVKPFLDLAKENGKGVFVLVKTSNPSSSEIQDLELKNGQTVYMKVAELIKKWGEYTDPEGREDYNLVGAVVGATHPEQAAVLRKMMPNTFFLVPGYGAQGATAKDITANFDNNAGGAIVNSSRGIMMAYNNERWKNKYSIETWDLASKEETIRAQTELTIAIKLPK